MPLNHGRLVAALLSLLLAGAPANPAASTAADTWVGTWAASPQLVEDANLPPAPALGGTTLRQVVRVSIGGGRLRVRFSNAFGNSDLTLTAARVARSAGSGAIHPNTDRALTFEGRPSVTVPAGAHVVSDAVTFDLPPLSDVAITIRVRGAPAAVTGHPGSRTTSFQAGDALSSSELPSAVRVEHWYFLSGIDVIAGPGAAAVAVVGDSITDGRGSTTDGNDRWPDLLARRLQSGAATIMPFEGFTYANYYSPEREAIRQRVNDWIRKSGRFDSVIDFDLATRDPARPSRLSAAVDGGDHLHPSAAGYRIMADAVDLGLFRTAR